MSPLSFYYADIDRSNSLAIRRLSLQRLLLADTEDQYPSALSLTTAGSAPARENSQWQHRAAALHSSGFYSTFLICFQEREAAALLLRLQQWMVHCLGSKRSLTKDCPSPIRSEVYPSIPQGHWCERLLGCTRETENLLWEDLRRGGG